MNVKDVIDNYTVTLIWRTVIALLVAGLGWYIMFPVRTVCKRINEAQQKLDGIHDTITVIGTNHVHTIEQNTTKTVELLGSIRESQMEMNGYLKGLTAKL